MYIFDLKKVVEKVFKVLPFSHEKKNLYDICWEADPMSSFATARTFSAFQDGPRSLVQVFEGR